MIRSRRPVSAFPHLEGPRRCSRSRECDRERVLQIGRALVDNALLHTPPGTRVRIVARPGALAVEDEGPGIPGEHQEQVASFNGWVAVDGYDNAITYSQRPGHSEHQLGLTIDFMTKGGGSALQGALMGVHWNRLPAQIRELLDREVERADRK